jgi:alkanesulfonate monooxygenase SsuD/methylene tetrahydromethanopterin reductase-like flavin-dependent oxidoreductase (luciferase family)
MKVSMVHLMPHRELPEDFTERYKSVWVTPPWHELVPDPQKINQYYNHAMDELVHAARSGYDAIGVNEHHQNAYGFMPNPNLMGTALARETNDLDVGILQIGSTLPSTQPAIRIAEEYAMLDQISGGRLIAGMPAGTSMDANQCMGIPPIEQRERYYEAYELIMRAWTEPEVFAFNGRYNQLPSVNIWPRPLQDPHPPVWIPGLGSLSTWKFAAKHNNNYAMLSFFGSQMGKKVMDGFWHFVDEEGLDRNPYRASFAQMVCVADTDAQAQKLFEKHIRYFFDKCMHVPLPWWGLPGHLDHASLANGVRSGSALRQMEIMSSFKSYSYKDFVDMDIVIAGSPATVADKLVGAVKDLRVGNLMTLQHIGSMPRELTKDSISLFCQDVLPKLRDMWDDEGWVNHWWPEKIRAPRAV